MSGHVSQIAILKWTDWKIVFNIEAVDADLPLCYADAYLARGANAKGSLAEGLQRGANAKGSLAEGLQRYYGIR
ncbi:hypothetical protein HDU97_009345 [Phlyctochytrium planicorne]|nr:hypothetical protein HDU97_009345 [Phlyctochytrium planicorne]